MTELTLPDSKKGTRRAIRAIPAQDTQVTLDNRPLMRAGRVGHSSDCGDME